MTGEQKVDLRNGFLLGSWTVYPLEGRLTRGPDEAHVQPKSMDVLVRLAQAGETVVERETLLVEVWSGRAQTDEPLTRCIGELRRALGDSRTEPRYIRTVPKRGYRLLQAAVPLAGEPPGNAASDPSQGTRSRLVGSWKKVAVAALVLVVAAAIEVTIERFFESGENAVEQAPAADVVADRSIAVLPFVDMSRDGDQEYFSDGISEELLNMLTKSTDLRVISRSSAFSFKGRNVDIGTIARQLRVTYILEGSVRKSGNSLRITAQLIDSRSDGHIWSHTYEREFGDIFEIQDEIAASVVQRVRSGLLDRSSEQNLTSPEAYSLILQARHEGRQFSADALERSVDLYERALQLEPKSAIAWAELSRAYRRLAGQGMRSYDSAYALARQAVERALHLDSQNAAANRGMAFIARNYDLDLGSAAHYLSLALQYDSSDVATILAAAGLAQSLGRLDDAIVVAERAISLDPVSPIANAAHGLYLQQAGRYEESLAAYRIVKTVSPEYIGVQHLIGLNLLFAGNCEQALDENEKEADEGYRLIGAAIILHRMGENRRADSALAELIEKYEHDAAYNIAAVYAYRNEADAAFDWLDRAVNYNDTGLSEIVAEPLFDGLRSDPRWLAFLERIGKSDAQRAAIKFVLPELH